MADINLIGNERSGSDRSERKSDHFEQSGGFDQGSFDSGSFGAIHESDFDSPDPYMDQNYMKKSSKGVMYILIGACVVLFGLLIYLLFSPEEKPKEVVEQQPKQEVAQTPATTTMSSNASGPNEEALNNVDALLNSFPPNLKMSVVRYSHGDFIIESHANSNEPIDEFNTKLRQTLQKGQIKESKKTKSNVSEERIGMIAGSVPQSSIWSRPDQLGQLSYVGESELKTRIQDYSRINKLQIKEYHVGQTRRENNFQKIMIKLQVVGDKEDATKLLKSLNNDKINVNFSKIVYVASDRSNRGNNVSLTVQIELFKKIS